jgi:hypothetical protein
MANANYNSSDNANSSDLLSGLGLGLETCGLGLGLETCGLGLGLETRGLGLGLRISGLDYISDVVYKLLKTKLWSLLSKASHN